MNRLFTIIANAVKRGGKRLTMVARRPFIIVGRKIKRLINPDSIVNKVVSDVSEEVKGFTKEKPVSLKDYFSIGK